MEKKAAAAKQDDKQTKTAISAAKSKKARDALAPKDAAGREMPNDVSVLPRGRGRPTVYSEELGNKILEFMAQGFSLETAAIQCDVHPSTVARWRVENADFSELMRVGKSLSLQWWENRGRDAAAGISGGSAAIISLGIRNRARSAIGWHHADTQRLEHTGKDGKPIQVEHRAKLDVTRLTPDQRDQLRELLMLTSADTEPEDESSEIIDVDSTEVD